MNLYATWPPSGWADHVTLSTSGAWTRSVEITPMDDGSYFAANPRGQTDGMWGEGETPDEAVDGLVGAIIGCAEVFTGRRAA